MHDDLAHDVLLAQHDHLSILRPDRDVFEISVEPRVRRQLASLVLFEFVERRHREKLNR